MSIEAGHIENIRILVTDDNPVIHEDFRRILATRGDDQANLSAAETLLFGDPAAMPAQQSAYALDFALQGQQAVQCVARARTEGRPYALAFVDMRMPPGWDGLETIERLWEQDPGVQIVICSAHSDYDWVDVVERLGSSDKFLILKKPFEPIEVLQCASALSRKWQHERALQAHVESLEQVIAARTEKLEAANLQLRHLATHDALTGLPNRVLLDDRLAQAIAHADRDSQPFAVLMVDLDRFKLINDSFGHRLGDTVLNEVARRLHRVIRSIDTVARVGGDEFVLVVSPSAARVDAEEIGKRANEALRTPIQLGGVDLHVSSSIGIAFYPGDGSSAESLLAHADAAMYCAKERGRNNHQCFAPGMKPVALQRMSLESELHQALKLKQFELFYQPKVDTATGDIHSAEALIRWRHPERGLIPPMQFIPLAEECGLIHDIGAWVLREACRQGTAWRHAGQPSLRLAVNVAASQFRRGDLLELVRNALQEAQLDPRFLEIELTESAVMTNPEDSAIVLEQLSRMGVLISVDDFGTGYSSMNYLRRFPIDKLKIDRSFIMDLTTRADDASIVQAIVSLAHGLRLKVVAEGVETLEQLNFLQSVGCDEYQGYHFSPPLPAADFAELLRNWQKAEDRSSADDASRTHSKLAAYR
ncbi:MAG: EAL domain-containing protein [Pseudomonadota bacterium]|nr:EAL domain-containing protein [Pseudomonadota bacterium]